ncbi:MFS transporter [Chloroflexota bacterium]
MNQEVRQSSNEDRRLFYGYIIVLAAFITQVVMFGPRSSFGVFFKPLLTDFGWTRALLSGAFSFSTIIQGLSGIFWGSLNDKLGPRVVMTICGFLLGLGYMLLSQIGAAWHLYLFYVVIIGVGMGGIYAPPTSTVARWFVKKRGLMIGIVVSGGGVGGLILPPLSNWLISIYGWRDAFLIIGVVVAVAIILAAQFLRRDPAQMGQLPYGGNPRREQDINLDTEGFSLREAIRTRQLWMTVAMLFCFGVCLITITVHIVPHATDQGISAATAANILATLNGALLIAGIALGVIADKIGNRKTFIICFILMAAALFWLLTTRETWQFYLFAVVMGFGGGGAAALVSPLAAEIFGMRSHGLLVGIMVFCVTLGAAFGPFMAGYVFDTRGSYQTAFLICATVSVIGLILASLLGPTGSRKSQTELL